MPKITSNKFVEENLNHSFVNFEHMLQKSQPGVVKALELFRGVFGNDKGLEELRVINLVLPWEVKKIQGGKLTYSDFIHRNTIYALENLIEEEKQILKKAFLQQEFTEIVSISLSKDREILDIAHRDIRKVLEKNPAALKSSAYFTKYREESRRLLEGSNLKSLIKQKSN